MFERHISPTDDEIRNALNLQTLASVRPKRITHPVLWFPMKPLDKLIAGNMLKSMKPEKALEAFAEPYLRLNGWLDEIDLAESLIDKDQP